MPAAIKMLLIGISIGLGLAGYQGTRQHVILPTAHAVQRTIRPLPQDKIDKENRKEVKAAKRAAKKAAKEGIPSDGGGVQQ